MTKAGWRLWVALLVAGNVFAATAAATPWDHGDLEVTADGRSIVHADGTGFFWMGDTAWMMIHRASADEVDEYYKDRAAKGFNVTLQVALGEIGTWNIPNRQGDRPFHEGDVARPNEAYWRFVDAVITKAEAHGIYVGLLPTWGRWVVDEPKITVENAYGYGAFIGKRYKDRPNLIWILGGDRAPLDKGVDYRPLWREMARGIRDGAGRRHLMSYHRKYEWQLNNESWYQIYMTGPAHGRRDNDAIVKAVSYDWNLKPNRPIVDGEPPYEDHPVGWDQKNGFLEPFDVRQGAYWSLFAGAVGHTYGHHSVWQWYWPPTYQRYGQVLVTAREGLDRPGAAQMRHVRALMESRPLTGRVPAQEMVQKNFEIDQGEHGGRHIRATRGKGFAFVYTPYGDNLQIALEHLPGAKITAWWFNPRDGSHLSIETFEKTASRTFDPPGEPKRGNDWVLVLDDAAHKYPPPGTGN